MAVVGMACWFSPMLTTAVSTPGRDLAHALFLAASRTTAWLMSF
jgi:hypothetical protein